METNLKVSLLTHTEGAEKIVAAAAKLCYSNAGIETIMDNLTPEKVDTFIEMLANIGHESPIEHCSFTFAIEGVSRALTHQLVRHRLASYSQLSQRYVNMESEDNFDYILPPSISENENTKALFENLMKDITKAYMEIKNTIIDNKVNGRELTKAEYSKIEKSALEDARFVLPNACETKIIVTMNARSLLHFFRVRCCNRAQWEIRAMADEMVKLVKEVSPTLFKFAGPSCLKGNCPEGKMSCGELREMQEKFLG